MSNTERILELLDYLKNNRKKVVKFPDQITVDNYLLCCGELDDISDDYLDEYNDACSNETVQRILRYRELVSEGMSRSASEKQAKADCLEYIIEHGEAKKMYTRLKNQVDRHYNYWRVGRDKLKSEPSKMPT